jgi:hypothetical protein
VAVATLGTTDPPPEVPKPKPFIVFFGRMMNSTTP